ncbi:MAG: hypothetical protein ACRDY2_13040 [Acidimicrobiales bacterium]
MRAGRAQSLIGVSLSLAAVLGVVAAGCGGTSPTTTNSTTPTTQSAAQVTAAVTSAWTKFFNYSTPTATRVSLLQDGTKYKAVISSLSKLLPKGTSVTVQGVKPAGTTASVTYSINVGSASLKSGLTGTAVNMNGKWLVSSTTFCGLLALAGATCPA